MSELGNPYISNPLKEFNRIYKKTNEIYHDIALRLGLSDSAFDILYSISELGDGCLQKDICNATCIPKQTIHSSIRQMEKSGYLTCPPARAQHAYYPDGSREKPS